MANLSHSFGFASEDKYPELITGVYIDTAGRRWFCIRRLDAMNCISKGSMYTSAYLSTFKSWGWKLAEDQTY